MPMLNILQAAAKYYPIDASQASLLKGNINYIYDCGELIIQITPANYRDFAAIQPEVAWVDYLGNQGQGVVKVVKSNRGNLLEAIAENTIICYRKIHGKKLGHTDWGATHFSKLGSYVGRLHQLGKAFEQQQAQAFPNWYEIPKSKLTDHLPVDDRQLHHVCQKLIATFNTYPVQADNYGLVHYDIHHGNYFITELEQSIVLFDFEMSCRAWYTFDIAIILYYILNATPLEDHERVTSLFHQHFISAYQSTHPTAILVLDWIPKFLLYRDLLVYGFTFKIWPDKNEIEAGNLKFQQKIGTAIARRRKALSI